jgi:hypothetical protein
MQVPCNVCNEWKDKSTIQYTMERRAVGKDKRAGWVCTPCHDSKLHKSGAFDGWFCVQCKSWCTDSEQPSTQTAIINKNNSISGNSFVLNIAVGEDKVCYTANDGKVFTGSQDTVNYAYDMLAQALKKYSK